MAEVESDLREDYLRAWLDDDCFKTFMEIIERRMTDLQSQLDGCVEADLKRVQSARATLKWVKEIPAQMKKRIKNG